MAIFLYLFTLLIYLFTLASSVYWGDSGEFTGVSYTLGIPHSTGYPLYTILSKIFTFLPISSVSVRCNFFSCFFASLAGLVLFFALNKLFQNKKISSLSTSLLFSFSFTFWENSLFSEVHTLNIFLIIFLIYLILENSPRSLYFAIFLCGVSLTNHNTVLPLIFSIFLFKFKKMKIKNISIFLFLFFLPISLYLFLPLRAIKSPSFNFGEPYTFERFFWLITGKGASLSFNFSLKESFSQIEKFWKNIFPQFNIFIIFSFLGISNFFKIEREKLFFLIFFTILSFLYAINIKIFEISPYFLPVFLSLYFFVFLGILRFNHYFTLIFPLLLIFQNFQVVSKNKVLSPFNFSSKILEELPEKSVLITPDNNIAFPLWYLQNVEGKNKNKIVIYRKLLPFKWYQNQLKNSFLNIPENLKNSERFSEKLSKEIAREIYLSNKDLKFYSTHFEEEIFKDKFFLPTSTVLKISEDKNRISYVDIFNFSDFFEERSRNVLSILLLERARAYLAAGELDFSLQELKKGIRINPNIFHFYNNLGYIYQLKGDLELAEKNYKKSLELNPKFSASYANLGVVYLLKNNIQLAEENFWKALSFNKSEEVALNNLYEIGILYFRKRELNSAEKVFKRLKKFSTSPSLSYALGIVYYKMGKRELAEKELKEYLRSRRREFKGEVEKLLEKLNKF